MNAAAARQSVKAPAVSAQLLPEQSKALLQELHLLTRTGDLNADALRKLKQINHLVGFLRPAFESLLTREEPLRLADMGSGNAYLGFILYELFLKTRTSGELWSVESREDLHLRSVERAARLQFGRMHFVNSAIAEAALPARLDVVTALHACDTATDEAIWVGLQKKAAWMALVPCCQAEVASLLKDVRGEVRPSFQSMFSHPWHRREFGSQFSNVVRTLVLESAGYQVTVTELAGWEHSLKNELILAKWVGKPNAVAQRRLEALLADVPVQPWLVRQRTARG